MASHSFERERSLLDRKEVYRQILDAIADMVLVKGAGSRIVWANKAFRDYYGMSNEQLHDIVDAPFNEQDNTAQYVRDDLLVYTTGEVLDIQDETVTRFDGVPQTFHTVKSPLRDADGAVAMTVGVSRNITDQKRVRQELDRYREHLERLVSERTREIRSLSDRLQIVVSSLSEGIIALDAAGKVELINPAVEALTGVKNATAIGMSFGDFIRLELEPRANESQATSPSNVLRMLLDGHRDITGWLTGPQQRRTLVSLTASPLIGSDGAFAGSVLAIRDITLEKEVEEYRLRQQKLESVGVLAGGIAHDFNNILTGILGSISVARMRLQAGEDLGRSLENAESACLRARGLTTQLLTFAKGGAPVKKPLALEAVVREATELVLHGSALSVSIDALPDLPWVDADEGQLGQVLGNLALNAKDAMPFGGELRIRIREVSVSLGDGLPVVPGRFVRVDVEDSGQGIPQEHLSRVFDPYFTTKSNGTGLGLASVHSIVSRHGGCIQVKSTLGKGSCFSLHLPARSPGPIAAVSQVAPSAQNSSRRLLLLDDEVMICQVMKAILERMGHDVVATSSSAQAFAAFTSARESGEPFDAAFVDLTLPGDLGGGEVVSRLRELDPTIKLVVMSGYYVDPIIAQSRERGLFATLQKPFNVDALKEIVDRI